MTADSKATPFYCRDNLKFPQKFFKAGGYERPEAQLNTLTDKQGIPGKQRECGQPPGERLGLISLLMLKSCVPEKIETLFLSSICLAALRKHLYTNSFNNESENSVPFFALTCCYVVELTAVSGNSGNVPTGFLSLSFQGS